MSFSELLTEFKGASIIDFNGAQDWRGPQHAYRLREEYEDRIDNEKRLKTLIEQPGAESLASLIIGSWTGACEGGSSEEAIAQLVAAAPRLPGLRSLFLGEMTYEECEISWINQSDVSPLLKAFPQLESFRVRGGSDLSFSAIEHASLKELAVETGGLSRNTIREIFLCKFSSLEHLELLLGEENYGFDGGVEDLQPVLSGKLYPRLRYLGLRNSNIADEIAAVVVNSPIIKRIETLDLSLGNLDDEGFQSLHALAEAMNLKALIVSHHYASESSVSALKAALHCEVDASDAQSADDEWRPIAHAE